MRIYYCEDRSAGNTGAAACPISCNIIQLFELTDWSVEDMDEICSLYIGSEYTTKDGIYVRRDSDTGTAPSSTESQIIGRVLGENEPRYFVVERLRLVNGTAVLERTSPNEWPAWADELKGALYGS